MALILDYTNNDTGLASTNAYIRISIRTFEKGAYLSFVIEMYSSFANKGEGKGPFSQELYAINNNDVDFDTYFSINTLDEAGINPFGQIYKYLLTLDGTQTGLKGLDFTSSINSMAEAQRDMLSLKEGDKVFNETTETFQTYTSGVWVND